MLRALTSRLSLLLALGSLGAAFTLALPACDDAGQADVVASVDITHPQEGSLVTVPRFRAQGTASGVDRIVVNGQTAEVVGGQWEVLLGFEQGPQSVVAQADTAVDQVSFTVDSRPPRLELSSPERGLYIPAEAGKPAMVEVAGNVSDSGTGVANLSVAGRALVPDAQGAFSVQVPLEPGMTELVVIASDHAGNVAESLRGVMSGAFVDPTQAVEKAFDAFVRPSGFEAVAQVIESVVTPEFVESYLEANFANENVQIHSVDFDPLDVEIVPRASGHVDVGMTITNAAIDGTISFDGGQTPTSGTIRIVRMVVTVAVTPSATADGGLSLQFSEPVLEIDDQDLIFDFGAEGDDEFLRDLTLNLARQAFGYLLNDRLIDQLFDPAMLTRKIEVLGRELVFELGVRRVDVFGDGVLASLSMSMPQAPYPQIRQVPGALDRPTGPADGADLPGDLLFGTTQRTLDRVLHGVWRSGLLHQELTGADFAGTTLPFELTSNGLATLLDPGINGLAPSGTPAAIRMRPVLPPVASFDGESSTAGIRIGEFMVDVVLLPQGKAPVPVCTLAFFLDLDVGVKVDGVNIALDFATKLRADLAEEPTIDLDDAATEEIFEALFALVPNVVSNGTSLSGEADITYVTLTQPRIEIHGADDDQMTFSAVIEPNPEGFEAAPEPTP